MKGAFLLEGGGGEDAIVGMVPLDVDAWFAGEGFKVAFTLYGSVGVGGVLAKVENVATSVIDEEAATCKTMLFSRQRGVEAAGHGGDVMICGNTIAWV